MNTQDYLQLFSSIPTRTESDLQALYETYQEDPSAVLLLAYIQRTLSSFSIQRGNIDIAYSHCERAWKHLQHVTDQAYGSNEDYVRSLQATTILFSTLALEGNDHMRWYKAVEYCKGLIEGTYPNFYRKDRNDTVGIQVNFLLTSLYNRIQQHDHAVDLSHRLQDEASKREDYPTEIRATINWALSTILLAKEKQINGKTGDADALMRSANHVVQVLISNPSQHPSITMYSPVSSALHTYLAYAFGGSSDVFIHAWTTSDDTSRAIMWDLLEAHSSSADEKLMHLLHKAGLLDD